MPSPIYPITDVSQEGTSPVLNKEISVPPESQDEEVSKTLPKKDVEEKLIDDVYDVNAVKSNYELESLRKDWVLDYMSIMEMR